MYIVAIGWAYVILMMAVTSSSVGKGLAIVVFLGIVPLAIVAYTLGGRRGSRSVAVADEIADERDAADTKPD